MTITGIQAYQPADGAALEAFRLRYGPDALRKAPGPDKEVFTQGFLYGYLRRQDDEQKTEPAVNAETWIVIIEDRHADDEVLPFSTEKRAIEVARDRAGHDGVTEEELTDGMRADGWVLCLPISGEGDSIRVVKRTVDRQP